ncbi:MAG: ABC-type maltose transport system permease subunit [Glaciecola sp.]|jgi:ABC-type maltose transport system permease subunit
MKTFTYILTVIAILLIGYNVTQINFDAPFEGQSIVALITVFAGLCAIILLAILRVSKKIEQTIKKKS